MLILAGVTLTIAFGENGIFERAKEAAKLTEIAVIKEQILEDIIGKEIEKGKVTEEDIDTILLNYGTLITETVNIEGEEVEKTIGVKTTEKEYEIFLADVWQGNVVASEPEEPTISVTGVTLDKPNITIAVGDTETLTATIAPSNATNKNVTWTSSNDSVATVENGTVTGVAEGTTTITCTTADGNKTATCSVIVTPKTISQVQANYVANNTTAVDQFGNKIVVPEGFKVTGDTNKVTEGIVITDGTNEFVWIPIGNISNGTTTKTITLSRYEFATDGTPTARADNYVIGSYYTETTSNTVAKNLTAFITSANTNGGYYLGRYEASDAITTSDRTSSTSDTNTMVSKGNGFVYNYVTRDQALSLCQGMYTGKPFTSDLINSYAWDTAIVFIQTFGKESNSNNYSRQIRLSSSLLKTGEVGDKQLNIHDMAGNVLEWSTETSSYSRQSLRA